MFSCRGSPLHCTIVATSRFNSAFTALRNGKGIGLAENTLGIVSHKARSQGSGTWLHKDPFSSQQISHQHYTARVYHATRVTSTRPQYTSQTSPPPNETT